VTGLALLLLEATVPQAALLLLGCRAPRQDTGARVALLPPCRAPLGPSALALPAHRVREGLFLILAALLALIVQLASFLALAVLLVLTAQLGNILLLRGAPLALIAQGRRLLLLAPLGAAGAMLESIRNQMKVAGTAYLAHTLWKAPDHVLCVMQAGMASYPVIQLARAMDPAPLATIAF
jgi:hypothetical protein